MTDDLAAILKVLRSQRDTARASGVELVGVVGSVARGDARPDSDLDLIVRQCGKTTMFTLSRLEVKLGRSIGRTVELVFSESMQPERRAYIERDLVPL